MPSLKDVEKQIRAVEGFDVQFIRKEDGRNVRSDMKRVPPYVYEREASGTSTVAAWVSRRCYDLFTDTLQIEPVVLFGDGSPAAGMTKLSTVRFTYPQPPPAKAKAKKAAPKRKRRTKK